jgi:hypothetical protein
MLSGKARENNEKILGLIPSPEKLKKRGGGILVPFEPIVTKSVRIS